MANTAQQAAIGAALLALLSSVAKAQPQPPAPTPPPELPSDVPDIFIDFLANPSKLHFAGQGSVEYVNDGGENIAHFKPAQNSSDPAHIFYEFEDGAPGDEIVIEADVRNGSDLPVKKTMPARV